MGPLHPLPPKGADLTAGRTCSRYIIELPTPPDSDTSWLCSKSPTADRPSHAAPQLPRWTQRRRTPGSTLGPCSGDKSGDRRERSLKGQDGQSKVLAFGWPPTVTRSPLSLCPGIRPHTLQLRGGVRAGQLDSARRAFPGSFAGAEKHTSSTRAHFQGRGPTGFLLLSSRCPWASHSSLTLRFLNHRTFL